MDRRSLLTLFVGVVPAALIAPQVIGAACAEPVIVAPNYIFGEYRDTHVPNLDTSTGLALGRITNQRQIYDGYKFVPYESVEGRQVCAQCDAAYNRA